MTQPFGDPGGDERELTQLVKDLNEAVVKADVAVLERFCTRTTSTTVRAAWSSIGRCTSRTARPGRVDFESLVPDEIEVRVYGDTAIVTGRSTAKGKDQYGTMDEQRRWTRVLVRRDGRWQFVHFQATPITKP